MATAYIAAREPVTVQLRNKSSHSLLNLLNSNNIYIWHYLRLDSCTGCFRKILYFYNSANSCLNGLKFLATCRNTSKFYVEYSNIFSYPVNWIYILDKEKP